MQADAAGSTKAGLQKWSLVNGTWQLDYVLQNGLDLGTPYSVPNYPASLNPATAGLRNITGKVNADGTVTVWGVTSTVSTNGDQGADPNKLVMITDLLANTTASGATNEQFTVVKSAAAGEVLRGVALTPNETSTMVNSPLILSAASPSVPAIAPGSIAAANGQDLAAGYPGPIFGVLPTAFFGTSVSIVDSAGNTSIAPLLFVSPNEVDFEVPGTVAPGLAKVIVASNGSTQTAANIQIAALAPALFTLNNSGLTAADAVNVSADGNQTAQLVYSQNNTGVISANPLDVGGANTVYLAIFGTGFDAAVASNTMVTVNGLSVPVLYAGPGGGFSGLDQINVEWHGRPDQRRRFSRPGPGRRRHCSGSVYPGRRSPTRRMRSSIAMRSVGMSAPTSASISLRTPPTAR